LTLCLVYFSDLKGLSNPFWF